MKEQTTKYYQANQQTKTLQQHYEQHNYWYGQFKFKPPMTYIKAKQFVLPNQEDVIMEKQWKINQTKQPHWPILFTNTVQCHARSITFFTSFKCMKQISTPKFVMLTQLNLQQIQLKNIQCLIYLDAPHLTDLLLCHNQIITTKSLIKMNFNTNKEVKLDLNPLWELDFRRFLKKQTIVKKNILRHDIIKKGNAILYICIDENKIKQQDLFIFIKKILPKKQINNLRQLFWQPLQRLKLAKNIF